jgi:phosphatidylinositol glycan class M
LQQGFQLEFNGHSTFVPGLWAAGILFFIVNVGILGIIIRDVKSKDPLEGKRNGMAVKNKS